MQKYETENDVSMMIQYHTAHANSLIDSIAQPKLKLQLFKKISANPKSMEKMNCHITNNLSFKLAHYEMILKMKAKNARYINLIIEENILISI